MRVKDLTGQRFVRLLVMSRAENTPAGSARWHCVCDCGASSVVRGGNLRAGKTKSCGCLDVETRVSNVQAGLAKRWQRHAEERARTEADGRVCKDCERRKPLSAFGSNRRMADGKCTRCKECMVARSSAWIAKNRDKFNAAARARYAPRRGPKQTPEEARAYMRHWAHVNKEAVRVNRLAYYRRRKERDPGSLREHGRRMAEGQRKRITDAYLAAECFDGLSVRDIPPALLAVKRAHLRVMRLLKEKRK